ncbi:MAG: F0F1 ATP synthase subunit epsilon [Peptococcaceae bacterium]
MAESTQSLEVVTPQRKVFRDDVEFVIVPGAEGELGFLPRHTALVSNLKIGEIRVVHEGKKYKGFLAGGFVEVRDSRVTIFTRAAERSEEIDRARAEAARERAEKRLAARTPDIDIARAEFAIKRALTRLKISENIKQ